MRKLRTTLKRIGKVFSSTGHSEDIRLRKIELAEIILRIRRRQQKKFGLFVIFGWRKKWDADYADTPDSSQDIFVNQARNIFNVKSIRKITDTLDFDGAILIDNRGVIQHSGIILEGLRPRRLSLLISPADKHSDLSTRLGFNRKVHARHLSAIASSWEFKKTTVYTVSEETGDVHIFENGRIIFSTVTGEGN